MLFQSNLLTLLIILVLFWTLPHFSEHVSHICSKFSRILGILRHIAYLLPLSARKLVYNALVLPHVNNWSSIWSSAPATSIHKLNVLLNKVCRAVLLVRWDQYHTQVLYRELDWLTLDEILKFNRWKIRTFCLDEHHLWTNLIKMNVVGGIFKTLLSPGIAQTPA